MARFPILNDPAVKELDRLMGTGVHTLPAGQAAGRTEDQFRFIGLALGIMAPGTGKRTAFKEHCRPDTRTIMD